MRVVIATVGKPRNAHLAAATADYLQRLSRWCRTEHLTVRESGIGGDEGKLAESNALLKLAPAGFTRICLDEHGALMTSMKIARFLEDGMNHADARFAFLVGGADGHHSSLVQQCPIRWSLSAATLPHELALLVLAEQLYRAGTILRGEPYHRE